MKNTDTHDVAGAALQASGGGASKDIVEPVCAIIPAGWFLMGCETGQDEEKPVHRVWVDAFEVAAVQVRNHDFALFLQATGHPAPPHWDDPDFNHPEQPVVAISWFEATKYCGWLSSVTGRRYRLPTEAEWERAARGGGEGHLYPWGDEPPQSWPEYQQRWGREVKGPLPVGRGSPNPYGLFDVSENVHEWCADWFSREFYSRSPERNPQGPETGQRRASRGGSWRHHVKVSRCAARSSIPPTFQYADYGFRLVRSITQRERSGSNR
jgi:formylglycine-generating enzyme